MLELIRSKAQGLFAWILVSVIIAAFALFGIEQYLRGGGEAHVASVNGTEISQTRLQQAYQAQRQRLQDMFGANFNPEMFPEDRMRAQLLEGLIQQELLTQAAIDAGLRISNAQLGELLRAVPAFQQDGQFSQALYERLVRESEGLSTAAFEAKARREIVAQQLQIGVVGSEFVTAQERASLAALRNQSRDIGFMVLTPARYELEMSVGDDEVARFYEENGARFTVPELVSVNYIELSARVLASAIPVSDDEVKKRYESQAMNYRSPEERKARHILIRVAQTADAKGEAEAKAKLEELLARVRKGESFAQLAKEHSEDPGSKINGGDLGFFGRGMMDPAFEAAAFALKKGEVSEVVRSRFGFHIIQLDDVHGGIAKPLAEVRNQIVSEIRQEQAEQRYFELAGKLGNLAYEHPESLDEASKQLGLPIQQSELFPRNGGTRGIAANAKVAAAAFSDEVLKSGNNSEAIEAEDKHLVVVHLREHQPEKRRTLEEVKAEIVAQLKRDKAKVRTDEVADTLLGRIAKGEDPKVIAKEVGAEWKRATVTREGQELPQPVVAQAFRMPRPAAQGISSAKSAMANGAQAVVALYGVTTPAEGADEHTAQRQLQQAYAEGSFESLLNSVKAKATIKR